ncbi:hypothetical protein [Streptomyces flavofungini]|uniref:hypothetical protein n=1 Tax=Streptomyces flavofungini TaxID=68200 RepID=UPI0034DDFE95
MPADQRRRQRDQQPAPHTFYPPCERYAPFSASDAIDAGPVAVKWVTPADPPDTGVLRTFRSPQRKLSLSIKEGGRF